MAQTAYPCFGGPLHGRTATYAEVHHLGYHAFNCANRHNRTKFAQKRATARGEVIPPSMVWLHESCFVGDIASGAITGDH